MEQVRDDLDKQTLELVDLMLEDRQGVKSDNLENKNHRTRDSREI
jgi:hypothetical protein